MQEILVAEVIEPLVFRGASYHFRTEQLQGLAYVEDGVPRIEDVWLTE